MITTRQLSVESRAHVHPGMCCGFAQVCYGKAARLRRMQTGHRLIYRSPTTGRGGLVLDEDVLQRDMVGSSMPFRRGIRYAGAREISLAVIKNQLDLCSQPNCGMAHPRGHLALSSHGFATVVGSIRATL